MDFSKWQRCLDIDHTINKVFIFLRDGFSIGPDIILRNEGRHKAFVRMAKCYFNINDHDNTRVFCKFVLDHTDCEDIDALEIFAKSLLATQSFKSASKYCQLAINCCETRNGMTVKRLQKLQHEINLKTSVSTQLITISNAGPCITQTDHQPKKEDKIQNGKEKTSRRRRPNRAKQHEKQKCNHSQTSNSSKNLPQETTIIYKQSTSQNKDEVKNNNFESDEEKYVFESVTDKVSAICSQLSPLDGSCSSSSDQNFSTESMCDDKEETSYYERSKSKHDGRTKAKEEGLLDMVINLDPSFLRKFEDRHPDVLKRRQVYESMLPKPDLENLLTDENKYVRGTIQIDGPHDATFFPIATTNCSIPIKIQGRGKIGQTFKGDEVVVELIDDKKNPDKRFGKVIGIFDIMKHDNVKQKIFACTLDEEKFNLVRPVCKTIPKLHVLDREISRQFKKESDKRYKVELYNYDKKNGTLSFSKIVNLQQEDINYSIFVAVYINWSPRHVYPRGAIIGILPTGQSVEQDLLITNITHEVPSLYQQSTVDEVDRLLQHTKAETTEENLEDRTNLCNLWTFTIDPPGTEDLDDALSVEDSGHHYRVGVHISDVSSYVSKNSGIDLEAKQRSQTFYSNIQNARCMLPEPLSKSMFSLLPNKLRKTLSIFFQIDKESFEIEHSDVSKTFIKSKKRFTYREAQDIISSKETRGVDKCNDQIQILYKISKTLRKRRLKNASFALETYFEESPLANDDIGTFQAHNLVEEFMILANRTIAEKLLKSKNRNCIPLRCHRPPSEEDIKEFLDANESHIDIVCRLQDKRIGTRIPSFLSNVESREKHVMVFKHIWKAMLTNDKHTTNYLRKDDLHPIQYLIYQNWIAIQETGVYRCSGRLKRNEETHYGLDIWPYTTFTSPIRRYIDLVVHRMVHATLITDKNCPYLQDELVEICQHANMVSKKVKDYEKSCKTIKLATDIGKCPRVFTCYVTKCTDREITVSTPSLKEPVFIQKEIQFNLLDIIEKPVTIPDYNTNSDSVKVVLRKRLYDFHPVIGTTLEERTQELNPNASVVSFVPLSTWVQLLRRSLSVKSDDQSCYDLIKNTKLEPSTGLTDVTTEIAKEIEADPANGKESRKCLVFKPSTTFALKFCRGQRLDIQMIPSQQKGIAILKASLISLTNNVKLCLQHTDDPVLYLSRYSLKATYDCYKDVKTYLHIWLPILNMEAAKCVLRNEESFTLLDYPVDFNQDRTGTFVLDENDCRMRNIEFFGFCFEDESRNNFKFPSYDWLCIKSSQDCLVRNDSQCKSKYFWVSHANITGVQQKTGKYKVTFSLHDSARTDAIMFNKEARFHIEVLKKSEVDRRTESLIQELENGSLCANIALRKHIPKLDDELIEIADKMDKDLVIKNEDENDWKPLPKNNCMQTDAICKALKSRFTLIQGPPGTGKTQTAIKLICLFTKMNREKRQDQIGRNQVLFCGPSNKSVDLVARWMLTRMGEHRPKFVRIYGQTIESDVHPIPGKWFLSKRSAKTQSADPALEAVSLHNLIRQHGNKYADKIREYETIFERNDKKRIPAKERRYIKLIARASIEEMKDYDVLLCTTAVGANPKLIKASNVSQIIIDEAGMCPEPHCLVPIIATKPEQVVLIGDHKQLRPIIMCKRAAELGLDKSLFERYAHKHSSTNVSFVMLNEQYRMHPQICQFPSEQFYDGALKTYRGYCAKDQLEIWPHDHQTVYPHVFINIEGEEEILTVSTEEGNEQSRSNFEEVKQVVKVYGYFTKTVPSESVQIISQYNAQCHEIKKELRKDGFVDVNVSTVVTSQGGEWDYVIFSTVRSLPSYKIERHPTLGWCKQNLGFITDRNQVNVALTRAKKGLIIIGNKNLLSCDEVWKNLIDYYEARGCILSPDKFPPPFKKTRQQIMKEEIQKHARRFGTKSNKGPQGKIIHQQGKGRRK
ncbi:helicase with zinc finger domain 2-like isoform X2 [Ruditapes philippinarum]|nr:helicase with zinc finger domain 2-like isoform X2 [Ruditapes philippinarum]XP_060566272.1 helicase with zinc finger domain 2-like isoform X2 [Ruditapes philippinarum]